MEFKLRTKIISFVLSLIMVFMAFPAEVVALTEVPTTAVENTVETADPQTEKVEVTVVSEDLSRRTATSKEFLLSDGSRMVAAYDHDVHYEENGEWVEIDNRLVCDEETGTYITENGGVSFIFSNHAGEDNMVRIENGEYTLAFGVSNIKGNANAGVKKAIKQNEKTSESRKDGYSDAGKLASEAGAVENIENTVTYEDGIDGIDFQYVLMGNTLRENIILNEKFNKYEYEFFVKADGMTAVLEEDGSITFSAQGDVMFTIPAPFMYDASGEKSTDVSYKLKEKKDGYYLTLTASKDWINAEERQFPVVIDPDIEVDVDDSSVVRATTLNHTKNSTSLYVGKTGTSEYQSYVKLSSLPVIPAGSLITGANVTMCQMYSGQGYEGDQEATIKIAVEKVTSSWTSSTTSFANVTTDGRILDYVTTGFDSSPQNLSFDITSAVIDWYNCGSYVSSSVPANYGLKFYRADDGTHDGLAKFFSVTASLVTEPFLKITYRDVRGISGLYSYQTLDIGDNDTAYVNDFAGNLVYEHTDYVSTADVMDFSIGHVYNSVTAYYGYNYVNTTCSNGLYCMKIHTHHYSNMYVGRGWKLNLYESLYLDSSTGYLIYNDASGMEYYLKSTDSGYQDEDGLGITVTGSDGAYTMSYEDGYSATKTFYNGMLYQITDEDGNYIQLVYNTTDTKPADYSRLTSVKQYSKEADTTVTIATFAYNSSNYLSTLTDQYGNETTYTYDNGYLTNITSTDGKSINYSYDTSSTAMLMNIHNAELNYGLNFEYENRKVSCFTEFQGVPGINQEYGNRIRVERNGKNRTATYAYDSKNDSGVYENKTYTTYVFDYNGQTVTTYSTDGGDYDTDNSGNLTLFGAAAYRYHESTSSRTNRLLKNYAVTGAESHNLITNGSAESGFDGWSASALNESDVFDSTFDACRSGEESFALTSNSGGMGAFYRMLSLKPGTTYTVSGYVKTDSSYTPWADGAGVYFEVDGAQSEHITDTYGLWERISVTFTTANSSASSVMTTLSVVTNNAYGTAYVDDIMVEEAEAPGAYNLVENSTFDVSGTVQGGTNAAIVSGGLNGSKALRLSSSLSTDAQAILQSGFGYYPEGQRFVLSGWAKAESVALREDSDATFGLEVNIAYADGTEETQSVSFNSETTAWQYVNSTIIPGQAKNIMYLGVYCKYGYNNGSALFDNISLAKSVVQSYNYDENGNVSEYSDGTRTYTYTYDADGKLESIVDEQGESISIDNENDAVTDSKNGVKSDTDVDGNSVVNVTSSVSTPSLKQTSTVIYTDASRTKVSSATDVNGITTTYTYNSDDLVLTEKIGDTTVNYRYNDDGTVSMTYISGVASVNYVYENGQLTEVSRGGYISGNSTKQTQKYRYTYDDFGNLLSLTVGTDASERALVAYSYSGVNGEVSRMTYGNGQYIDYTYDEFERVSQVGVNGTSAYTYTYDNNGNVARVDDLLLDTGYLYYYDENGALAKSVCTDDDHILRVLTENGTTNSRVESTVFEIDSSAQTYSFVYCDEDTSYAKNNDDLLRRVNLPNNSYLLYGYDNLNRRPYAKTYTSSGTLIFDTLTKFQANGDSTTNLVSYYRTGNSTDGYRVFTYTYDAYGNISQINEGSSSSQSVRHKYTYDAQSQLIMDVDYDMDCTRVYVYDTYGNIRSKAELTGTGYTSYSNACAAMTSSNTDTYTYGDSAWLDLLTAYNGNAITYDTSGNPLAYYNGMTFTWGNGRQLSTLTTSTGDEISYEYNMDGIRTAKTVNGVTTEYIVNGGMILQEICGSTVYNYYYDENGAPVAMKKGSTTYYFEKNAQGDIVALFDANGAEVAHISYDAYGNAVHIYNPSNLYIPFRYRGYYYDADTGFYYLQSRYYDPETGRFLNADDVDYLGIDGTNLSYNLFAYCGNNVVNYFDRDGESAVLVIGGVTISAWMVVVMAITLLYTISPRFRDLVCRMLWGVIQCITTALDYLRNVINDVVITAKSARKYSWYEKHHIVAKKDRRASYSRSLLKNNKLDCNGWYNTVYIKNTLHRHLHTNAYHAAVAGILYACQNWARRNGKNVSASLQTGLLIMKAILATASTLV